jgi:hypothetical protein
MTDNTLPKIQIPTEQPHESLESIKEDALAILGELKATGRKSLELSESLGERIATAKGKLPHGKLTK